MLMYYSCISLSRFPIQWMSSLPRSASGVSIANRVASEDKAMTRRMRGIDYR